MLVRVLLEVCLCMKNMPAIQIHPDLQAGGVMMRKPVLKWRRAQLCLYFKESGKEIHDKMISSGIIVDYREPGVIRVAPAPMYCSFEDVYRFYEILKTNF